MARPQARPPLAEYAQRERQSRSRRAYSAIGATSPPCRHLATGRRTRAAHPRGRSRSFREFGLEMPPPRVGGALGSGAAPRRANFRDQLATSVPRIHPRFCPIPAHQVPRAASRAKFAPFPTSSSRPRRRSSAVRRPRTGPGTGQVWILHGAAVYLRAHGAFRGVPEACRLRGAAIARRRRCVAPVTPTTRSQCVCSASTPATVTPSVLAYTG